MYCCNDALSDVAAEYSARNDMPRAEQIVRHFANPGFSIRPCSS